MIRKYMKADRARIEHLYRDEPFPEPTLSCYLDKHYKPFVYEKDGKILGVIMLQQDYLMLDIFNLYVDADHRGKGIGQALLSFAEGYARKKKLHGVKIEGGVRRKEGQFLLKMWLSESWRGNELQSERRSLHLLLERNNHGFKGRSQKRGKTEQNE